MNHVTRGLPNLLTLALVLSLGTGCSLIVGFDRDRIMDAGEGTDGGDPMDGGADAGTDAGMEDAGPPPCGNGMLDTDEACDDGNVDAGDGCSDTCTVEDGWTCDGAEPDVCAEVCGDGMTVGDEACDDGFETACGDCNADCTATGTGATCGDGAICTDSEVCDDSNTDDLDGCASDCAMIETGWVCTGEPSMCAMTCSNGVLDMGEECDDGANEDGDGCSAACMEEDGWSCMGEPSMCMTMCGDGIVAGDEECDDGDTDDDDGCATDCIEEAGWTCTGMPMSTCDEDCGDGMEVGSEACDDGNTVTEDACPYGVATCMPCNADCSMELMRTGNVCGDGVVSPGNEECDDDGTDGGDGCNGACNEELGWSCSGMPLSTCMTLCGDGIVAGDEECDDGDMDDGDGCSAGCTEEDGWTCTGTMPTTCDEICGDGMTVGTEMCDDGNAFMCGLCPSADCDVAPLTAARATAMISASTGDDAVDGATLVLDDGVNPTVTFEINTTGGFMGTNEEVVATPGLSATQVAENLAMAVNGTSLNITASATSGVVTLTNNTNGEQGNTAITTSIGFDDWTVPAMFTGGVGRTCGGGVGCTSNNDCVSGSCAGGTCAS